MFVATKVRTSHQKTDISDEKSGRLQSFLWQQETINFMVVVPKPDQIISTQCQNIE